MKVLHVPFGYYPDPVGGTEIYVQQLSNGLQQLGFDSIIFAPGQKNEIYQIDKIPVRRFNLSTATASLTALYGQIDSSLVELFGQVLDQEQPDVVHIHAFVGQWTPALVAAVKHRQLPLVFTYHTPTASCLRGTLLKWGTEICDGRLSQRTCTECLLQSLGANKVVSYIGSNLSPRFGKMLGSQELQGDIWTALRMSELVQTYHSAVRQLWHDADVIVALCKWVEELLTHNNVPSEKVVVCRHGINGNRDIPRKQAQEVTMPLRLVYLGRMDKTKGPDTVIKAIRLMPTAPLHLDLYGIVQGKGDGPYLRELHELTANDERIHLLPPVPNRDVLTTLHNYDVLVVPSNWLETGPLVVLEAFAAGIPVLGSRLGGISEWIEDGKNGLLVTPNDPFAWSTAIQRLLDDPAQLTRFARHVSPPRAMHDVASDMSVIYAKLTNSQ